MQHEPSASAQVFPVPGFTREFLGIQQTHVYPGTKLRRVVPGLSVPRINLGKKLTG